MSKLPYRYVTKVSWDKLREPFRRVWSREEQFVEFAFENSWDITIERISKGVRIFIPDDKTAQDLIDMYGPNED